VHVGVDADVVLAVVGHDEHERGSLASDPAGTGVSRDVVLAAEPRQQAVAPSRAGGSPCPIETEPGRSGAAAWLGRAAMRRGVEATANSRRDASSVTLSRVCADSITGDERAERVARFSSDSFSTGPRAASVRWRAEPPHHRPPTPRPGCHSRHGASASRAPCVTSRWKTKTCRRLSERSVKFPSAATLLPRRGLLR